MAIHEDDIAGNPAPQYGQQVPPTKPANPTGQQGSGYTQPPNPQFDFPNMFPGFGGDMFGSVISGDSEGEIFKKFCEVITPHYEKLKTPGIEVKVVEVDRSQYIDINFSALVICSQFEKARTHGVAYHVMLLEGTGKKLDTVKETVRDGYTNREIEMLTPSQMALDRDMMNVVLDAIGKVYGNTPTRFAGHTVVPADFDVEDKAAVRRLAHVVSTAAGQELATSIPGFRDINLVAIMGAVPNANLTIDISFDRRSVQNFVGHPTRSDVQTVFTLGRKDANRAYRPNAPKQEWTASEVDGFIDLVPAPNGGIFNTPYGPQRTPPYVGNYIATQVSNNSALTLGGVFLSLLTAFPIGANENWVQVFAPRKLGPDELDLTDIGALNIDANLKGEENVFGTPFTDTRNADFSLRDVGQLMGQLVGKGLLFSVDCSVAGPDSWYLSVLRAAEHSPAARALILSSIDLLTNGNFSKIFNPLSPLTMNHDNVIHMGYWFDRKKVKRDIREFDLVAVCNLMGKSEPTMIRKWLETFYNRSIPQQIRLANRWNMIYAMSGDSAVCTGTAERITLSNDLVIAAMAAMYETKIPVAVRTPLSAGDFSYQRPSADFVGGALVQNMPSFHQPSAGGAGFSYSGSNYRWGR